MLKLLINQQKALKPKLALKHCLLNMKIKYAFVLLTTKKALSKDLSLKSQLKIAFGKTYAFLFFIIVDYFKKNTNFVRFIF